MKHQTKVIYPALLLLTCLLCACRTTKSRTSKSHTEVVTSQLDRLEHKASGTISSQVSTQEDTHGNSYRIVWHFDTSLPTDPDTGLPPVSSLEIEGSQTTQHASRQEDTNTALTDSLSINKEFDLIAIDDSDSQSDSDRSALTQIGEGIKTGLIIGIPVTIILIALIYYVRKKNSSK